MSKSPALAALNALITAKQSALTSFKASRLAAFNVLSKLPKGHRALKGGHHISKEMFLQGMRHNIKPGVPVLPAMQEFGLKITKHHLDEGSSTLRKLKKLRKNLGSDRDTTMRINLKSYKDTGLSTPYNHRRKIIAEDVKGHFLGRLDADFNKGDTVDIIDTRVREKMRGKGIGTALFDKLAALAQKAKKSFVRTSPGGGIIAPEQISVRDRYKTKYLARGVGRYGDGTELINSQTAKRMLNKSENGQIVAITNVNRQNVRFIRNRFGKIVPIRIKK